MTPHNKAQKNEIAQTVIMPGDPLRATWIAKQFLKDARLVSDVRGIPAYTGSYNGKELTVMAHGMGIPSMGIYSYELYKFYDVETIIRVGSAGSYSKDVKVGDILIAQDVTSFSRYAEDIGVDVQNNTLRATDSLTTLACETAREQGIQTELCRVFCSESFYNKYSLEESIKRSQNAQAVEMEGFALYANAISLHKQALMLLTCSDSLVTGEAMSADDRQLKFGGMVKLALETALNL
ncbi:MAG: purine-nucleoside phosphorylase [Spirochaetaceae bacterium]|jgi:purine-nucleoside phosphorylase|nr:purine-nucleoside phosphorylase [Spirochaetaceae bacterium]